jgi:hypothetical protein
MFDPIKPNNNYRQKNHNSVVSKREFDLISNVKVGSKQSICDGRLMCDGFHKLRSH